MTPDTMALEIKEIIKRLKECVENSNLTYVELEKRTGIAKSSIQRYVSGVTKKIPVDSIQAIANAVGVSPKYILGWDNNTELNANQMLLSNHEQTVITAYRDKPEMQPAIDKILGIIEDDEYVLRAARSKTNEPVEYIKVSKEKLEEIRNAKSVEDEVDL